MTHTIICSPGRYLYRGVTIELGGIGGPCPVKPNGDPYERWPRAAARIVDEWWALSEPERERYRVGGGCVTIGG